MIPNDVQPGDLVETRFLDHKYVAQITQLSPSYSGYYVVLVYTTYFKYSGGKEFFIKKDTTGWYRCTSFSKVEELLWTLTR